MQTEITKEIFTRLDALAAKLGVTAQHLWGVLVRQAGVERTFSIVGMAVGALILVLAVVLFVKATKSLHQEEEVGLVWLWGGILLSAVGLVDFFTNLYWLLTCTTNPEYWALKQVLEVLGK